MDRWDAGSDYEVFMGRWSRLVAEKFVKQLRVPPGLRWLDVGCGTGALLDIVLDAGEPAVVAGVDPSREFVAAAQVRVGERAEIRVAGGDDLPFAAGSFEVVVSGLVLNFLPDPLAAVREWRRVTQSDGSINAYVWDYAEGMGFLRVFWDAVVAEDPDARHLDEAIRFPICDPNRLGDLFAEAGLSEVGTGSIEIDTRFVDFDDYWVPFLRGQGPAPTYVSSLPDAERAGLEHRLRAELPRSEDGTIDLTARAWIATGTT